MQIHKRMIGAFSFLVKNPLIFVVFIPLALLPIFTSLIPFDSSTTLMFVVYLILYLAVLLIISSFIFSFTVFKVAYDENNKPISFKQAFSLSRKKFPFLMISEALALLGILAGSTLLNYLGILWTSALGMVVSILLSLALIFLLVKILLFIPSCVIKGGLGFKESWETVKLQAFLDLAVLLIVYALLSNLISMIPYAGIFIGPLILGPLVLVLLTMLYMDYLKK